MIHLIKIGNSQGVRIPKALIEQAELSNRPLQFELLEDGLLIKPVKEPRSSWENSIKEICAEYKLNQKENDWLDLSVSSDDDWQW